MQYYEESRKSCLILSLKNHVLFFELVMVTLIRPLCFTSLIVCPGLSDNQHFNAQKDGIYGSVALLNEARRFRAGLMFRNYINEKEYYSYFNVSAGLLVAALSV